MRFPLEDSFKDFGLQINDQKWGNPTKIYNELTIELGVPLCSKVIFATLTIIFQNYI